MAFYDVDKFTERVIMDKPTYRADGYLWCHLTAQDLTILHNFAQLIGLQQEWFQDKPGHPHYDIKSKWIRNRAERLGAVIVEKKYFSEYLNHFYGQDKKDRTPPRGKEVDA